MDELEWARHNKNVRAKLIERSEEYAEAFAELWQAEEPYVRLKATRRRKSFDKAAYRAAKKRYEAACYQMDQVVTQIEGLRLQCESESLREYQAAKPTLTDPVYFVAWLRKHVGLYFIALHDPARVFMIPRWPLGVWEQYQRRYILLASVHRAFMADGVEAAMRFFKEEEIERKLWESAWDSSETEKIEGDPAYKHKHPNGRFDGGRYETYIPAPLTPIISPPREAKRSNRRPRTSRLAQ